MGIYDYMMEQEEISDFTAEYWESRPDYTEVMAEMCATLPDATPEELDEANYSDWLSDCFGQGMYDDDPSPYDGTYSEE